MKTRVSIIFAAVALVILSGFQLIQKQTTLYIIGDSTAANKQEKAYPETGWGMELQSFFNDEVKVDNRALNGRSTKSFRAEKRWEPILENLKAGDYVLIEFGHNDEKVDKPAVGVSLADFKINLVNYVNETRSKKAIPVLLTPISRRSFKNGILTDTHGGYPDVTRKVADSLKVPLIDMLAKTEKLLSDLGDEGSIKLFLHVDSGHVNYPKGKKDDTHLSPNGAKQIAGLVAKGIKENKLSIARKLK
ncbi:GntR family transcriptional regulator [Pedobacter petrophilus]|uniref:GntR family transcriptional regulator n=1 Tax=Pedobacter petrophilus TaxID=1908241 RepID=A0A7K0G2P8_9SPHI|nr:rhamnogalacturonan acetylesterase [Pedobacter petrophilus]MRX77549.1 GntR family transcriptional regulator [Pedobacter petrophilus]